MKPEEAIEILELPKDALKSGTHYHAIPSPKRISYTDYLNARKAAIKALEKQIPTKPEMYIGDYEFERWSICPKCKGELHPNGEKFCSDCGQAIDWSQSE